MVKSILILKYKFENEIKVKTFRAILINLYITSPNVLLYDKWFKSYVNFTIIY